MEWLSPVLMAVQVISSLSVIVLVLLQQGKGADMGSAFGSGSAGSLFGAAGAANFLSRTTKWAAIAFFASTAGLAWVSHKPDNGGAIDSGVMQGFEVPQVPGSGSGSVPAAPNGAVPSAPAVPNAPSSSGASVPQAAGQADGASAPRPAEPAPASSPEPSAPAAESSPSAAAPADSPSAPAEKSAAPAAEPSSQGEGANR